MSEPWPVGLLLDIQPSSQVFFFFDLGFNDTTTPVGHFVSSSREREKRDRRGDEGEGERKMNESEETEKIKTPPFILTCYNDSRPCPAVIQYQLDAPVT